MRDCFNIFVIPRDIFTPKMTAWLIKNRPNKTIKEIVPVFNKRFKTNFTYIQIRNHCVYKGIKSGIAKGGVGNVLNVGTEKVFDKSFGTVYVKISNKPRRNIHEFRGHTGMWRQKHFVVWEAVNGPIPRNHLVIFANGNKNDFDINNLLLVHKKELWYMGIHKLLSQNPEVTKTNLLITRHRLLILKRAKKLIGNKRDVYKYCKQTGVKR